MAVRSKDDTQALRELARTMFFSNATVDEFLARASAAQARAICSFIEIEQRNRAANKHAKLMRKAKFPAIMGFDGYDFSNVVFPEGYAEQDIRSLRFIDRRQVLPFRRAKKPALAKDAPLRFAITVFDYEDAWLHMTNVDMPVVNLGSPFIYKWRKSVFLGVPNFSEKWLPVAEVFLAKALVSFEPRDALVVI